MQVVAVLLKKNKQAEVERVTTKFATLPPRFAHHHSRPLRCCNGTLHRAWRFCFSSRRRHTRCGRDWSSDVCSSDLYFDLVALYYMLKYGEPRGADRASKLPVWVPPGGRSFFDKLGRLIADRESMLEDVFALDEYAPGESLSFDGLALTLHPVKHYVPSH